jgi:hypothetical protein
VPASARRTNTVNRLDVVPQTLQQGAGLTLRATGWGGCPVQVRIDGRPRPGIRVARGFGAPGDSIQPDAQGDFVAFVSTLGLAPGKHRVEVISAAGAAPTRRSAHFIVTKWNDAIESGESGRGESPFTREVELWRRRFSKLGYVPTGILLARRRDLQRMRRLKKLGIVPYDRPITPGCNWTPLGPSAGYDRSNPSQSIYTGKIHAIAIDPTSTSTVYAGASGGGVWKTTDSGATWAPKSDYQSSLAIGTLAIDPNNNLHIIAGTGIDPIGVLDYYGNGLLISTDGGDTWTEAGSSTFNLASISRIIFDPTDPTSKHLLLSSSLGVYESHDGGMSWTQLFAAVTTDMVVIPEAGGTLKALVGVRFQGIYTSTLTAGSWSPWTQISDPSFTTGIGRVVFGQCAGTPTTIYAALEKPASPDSLGIIVRTPDGGSTWASAGKPPSSSSQTWHAFILAVHPTDSNTVFYGEVHLWQTTTGGAPWTNVTDILHADQNAFAFDPVTPTTVWSGNDGGIWRSSGAGAVGTWAHANYGLATFKCLHGAHHPQWDAVFLISTQDNGTFRGDGQPVWPLIFGLADTGPVAIDPSRPLSYFTGGGYVLPEPSGRSIWRSDDAGNTFTDKTNGITGNAMFYAPFVTDPGNAGVCWFATDSLWRSPDQGDTWTQITNTLVTGSDPNSGEPIALSAIILHPSDPNMLFTASSDGRVFQVQRTGATWTIADVTVTELTASPLPTGICISSLAVDAGGYLWASVSSILYTVAIGEFSSDHVYRYDHVAGAWASRSTGLAQANPVNVIVADPSSATTLYCGADAGVFQTTDGMIWVLWDDGLPEAPVVDLLLHQPTRLLRAVTHGRSVWERSVSATACASVDLYFRDDLVDTGRVQPSYSGVADPFRVGITDYWYQSEDIKVDGPAPNYQSPAPVTDFVTFEALLQHTSPRRGVVNRFYGRVQNRGPLSATNVKLRAFFADAHAGLPLLPMDFWSNGAPFDADPSVSAWTPIGPAIPIPSVAPGMPAIIEWDWTVPATASDHSCLLLLATCDENVLNGSGTFVVDALVPVQKMVTLKNLQVEDAVMRGMHRRWMGLSLYNPGHKPALYDLVVDWGTLPVSTELYILFEASRDPILAATKAELKVARAAVVSRVAGSLPTTYPMRCGRVRMNRAALRVRRHAGELRSVLPVLLPGRRSVLLLLKTILPKTTRAETYQFDVQQRTGTRLIGGSTYVLRVKQGG